MTPTIKPSSIVHTMAQVEAMARSHDAEGKFHKSFGNESVGEFHRDTAAMLRELAGGMAPTSPKQWRREIDSWYVRSYINNLRALDKNDPLWLPLGSHPWHMADKIEKMVDRLEHLEGEERHSTNAGSVPVSDDEYWFMSASGEPYRVLDPRINQHRAST